MSVFILPHDPNCANVVQFLQRYPDIASKFHVYDAGNLLTRPQWLDCVPLLYLHDTAIFRGAAVVQQLIASAGTGATAVRGGRQQQLAPTAYQPTAFAPAVAPPAAAPAAPAPAVHTPSFLECADCSGGGIAGSSFNPSARFGKTAVASFFAGQELSTAYKK